jgi:hypothetical protein
MASKRAAQQHNQLLWLAILVMGLLMIPFMIGIIQKRSFELGFAKGVEKSMQQVSY